MPFIQNVSLEDIKKGTHKDPGANSMLIQIVDPGTNFPQSKKNFRKVRKYKFLDMEVSDNNDKSISDEQAQSIAEDLKYALDHDMNVIVHCHMGACRSGAVVEVGIMIGFSETGRWRLPNQMVKHKLMKCLNLLPYGS